MPEIEPFVEVKAKFPQSKLDILDGALPIRMGVISPSGGGKTTAVIRLILDKQFFGGLWSKVYWISPTAHTDEALDPLREHVKTIQDQDEDPSFHSEFNTAFVQSVLDKARDVTARQKESGSHRRFKLHG